MSLEDFNNKNTDAFAARARAAWGGTREYAEYAEKAKGRTKEDEKNLAAELTGIFAGFGEIKTLPADGAQAAAQVEKLRRCITVNCYSCTDEVLASLGRMYAADGEFRANIDSAGGEGTAAFASLAIKAYCEKRSG